VHLRNLDLNLLVTLDVLLRERSVTRTAQALYLSQSAVSHALGRLRDMLGDPLLVRGPGGMVPTQYGEELQQSVHEALQALQLAISRGKFDPAQSTQAFYLGTTDYVEYLILPRLMERVYKAAPNVRIMLRSVVTEKVRDDLVSGHLDMAVSFAPQTSSLIHIRRMMAETYSCVMRADMFGRTREISLRQYLNAAHCLVSPSGTFSGAADAALARIKRHRNVVLSTPRYLSAAEIVARSDMILTIQARLAKHFTEYLPLKACPTPFRMPANYLGMQWSERTHNDPAHQWLRGLVVEVCEEIGSQKA